MYINYSRKREFITATRHLVNHVVVEGFLGLSQKQFLIHIDTKDAQGHGNFIQSFMSSNVIPLDPQDLPRLISLG